MSSPQAIAITLTPPPAPAPPSIWENGTVFVAFFALVGVVLTVFASHWKGKQDRAHGAAEAHRERIAATRREVYLEAVEALGTAQKFLGALAGSELAMNTYEEGLMPLITAVNKVAIVGEMDTVTTARELLTLVNQTFFKAAALVVPIYGHYGDARRSQERWQEVQTEIKRLLAATQHHVETHDPDRARFETLMRSFAHQQSVAAEQSALHQEANRKLVAARMEYGNWVVSEAAEFALKLDVLAESVRKELEIKTDFEAFRAQTVAMQAAAVEAMAKLNASLAAFQEREE